MGRRVIGMGTLRFPRARSHHQDRPFAAPTIPRSRAMDQIRKPLAPTDRGLRDEGFRVRRRVGPALRRVRTAPIRRRSLVQRAVGTWLRESWKKDRERTAAFLRAHARGLPPVTITVATERAPKAFREKLRRDARAATRTARRDRRDLPS